MLPGSSTSPRVWPVSNLTNLLAVDRLHWSAMTYARHTWPAALAAVVVTALVLFALHHRELSGRYVVPRRLPVPDRLTFWLAASVCVLLGVLFVAGVPYWAAASAGAVLLGATFAWRRREALTWSLLPLPLVVTTLDPRQQSRAAAHGVGVAGHTAMARTLPRP
jgi:arsenical pump membrane protein